MDTQIRIRTTNPDGTAADVTSLCKRIVWSGDYRNAARTLMFSPVFSPDTAALPAAPTELGGSVRFSVEDKTLMDAWSLVRVRDSLGTSIDVTAYDRGVYLTRNSATLQAAGQTPEALTAALCAEYGIQAGAIAETGVKIRRNFVGVSLYRIIMTLYTLAAETTGEKYAVRFEGEKLSIVKIARTDETILLTPGSNILSLTAREDASRIINSVAIYGDYTRQALYDDAESVALYGLMQQAVKLSAEEDAASYAGRILRENGLKTTITASCIGNLKLVTGNTAAVREPVTNTFGLFWIVSDTHTWERGVYTTKVTLSLEALMDSQSAGAIPKE